MPQHKGCHNSGYGIGNRHAVPHAILTEYAWQDEDAGQQEEQLARERQEDGLAGHTNALKEVARYHLETHNWEEYDYNAHGLNGNSYQLFVSGEDAYQQFGNTHAKNKG